MVSAYLLQLENTCRMKGCLQQKYCCNLGWRLLASAAVKNSASVPAGHYKFDY